MNALSTLACIVLLGFAALGFSLSKPDLLNPTTANADASIRLAQMQMQLEGVKAAQEAALAAQQAQASQDLANAQLLGRAEATAILLVATIFVFCLVAVSIAACWRLLSGPAQRPPAARPPQRQLPEPGYRRSQPRLEDSEQPLPDTPRRRRQVLRSDEHLP